MTALEDRPTLQRLHSGSEEPSRNDRRIDDTSSLSLVRIRCQRLNLLMGETMEVVYEITKYGPGGQYPARRIEGSRWVIVDATGWNWRHLEEWPELAREGTASSYDVHYDADDPLFTPVTPEAFYPVPGADKLSRAYNAPFTRSMRWRIRRAVSYESISQVTSPHDRAEELLTLAAMIRENPSIPHSHGRFTWSVDGDLLEDGSPRYRRVLP